MDKKTEIEAATFRRIVKHLRENPDVQNIDLMNLANFCRNCISKWYVSESASKKEDITYDEARELIYGMPYAEYKEKGIFEDVSLFTSNFFKKNLSEVSSAFS